MPLYEYQCEQCGQRFEVMQKFSDAPLTQHDQCGGPVHRLISAPALQFKGSGWYITDYAKNANPSGNGSPASKSDTNTTAKTGTDAPSTTPAPTTSSSDTKSGSSGSSSDTK